MKSAIKSAQNSTALFLNGTSSSLTEVSLKVRLTSSTLILAEHFQLGHGYSAVCLQGVDIRRC